jgi:hypothetical protein
VGVDTGENNPMKDREADTEIMLWLPEQFLELVSFIKEANKNFTFNLICLKKIFIWRPYPFKEPFPPVTMHEFRPMLWSRKN